MYVLHQHKENSQNFLAAKTLHWGGDNVKSRRSACCQKNAPIWWPNLNYLISHAFRKGDGVCFCLIQSHRGKNETNTQNCGMSVFNKWHIKVGDVHAHCIDVRNQIVLCRWKYSFEDFKAASPVALDMNSKLSHRPSSFTSLGVICFLEPSLGGTFIKMPFVATASWMSNRRSAMIMSSLSSRSTRPD